MAISAQDRMCTATKCFLCRVEDRKFKVGEGVKKK